MFAHKGARATDSRQLTYFVKVYQLGSFTKAADELYTSRQAFTHSIRMLEKQLGAPLFEVEGRTLVPTLVAEHLYPAAAEAVLALGRVDAVAGEMAHGGRRLRCGMTTGIHDVYTREEFTRRHLLRTSDYCTYVTTDNDSIRRMLREGEIDVGYVISRHSHSEEFASRYDQSGRLHLMVNRSSPLAARSSVRILDLKGVPFVSQGPGYDLHALVAEKCRRAGFELEVHYTASSFFDTSLQVNDDLGVTYFPRARVTNYDMPNVVCVPFEEEDMDWYLLHVVRRGDGLQGVSGDYWNTESGFPELREPTEVES